MSNDLHEILERRIQSRAGKPRRTERRIPSSKPDRRAEVTYRRELVGITTTLTELTERHLFELLTELEPQFLRDAALVVADGYGEQIEQAIGGLRAELQGMEQIASQMAERHISTVNRAQRKVFYNRLERATQVDLEGIVTEEGLEPLVGASVRGNVNLITSIPEQYFQKLEGLLYRGMIQGNVTAGGLRAQIMELGDVTKSRAQFIARDQTAKLNADFNEARMRNLGIEEYIWRITGKGPKGDGRVRETHIARRNKRYRWDTPPAGTGHPGQDYQCRCTAEAVLPASLEKRAAA